MKTLNVNAETSINLNNVSLEGFIVKETLANDGYIHHRLYRPSQKTVFTIAELRRIQNKRKNIR